MKPIVFHKETKDWLSGLEWPPTAYEDFDQIAKHNDKYYLLHPNGHPTTQQSDH